MRARLKPTVYSETAFNNSSRGTSSARMDWAAEGLMARIDPERISSARRCQKVKTPRI
jgi:hypothetical protein